MARQRMPRPHRQPGRHPHPRQLVRRRERALEGVADVVGGHRLAVPPPGRSFTVLPAPTTPTSRTVRSVVRYLLLFLGWNILISLGLVASIGVGYPLVGLALMVGLYLAFLWRLVMRSGVPSKRLMLLRLRPLRGEVLKWTLLAVPVLLVLSWAVGEVYVRLVPVPPENFDPFGTLLDTASGRLSLIILAVGIAPVLEEFFFRGFIQRLLERRFGTSLGIGIAPLADTKFNRSKSFLKPMEMYIFLKLILKSGV